MEIIAIHKEMAYKPYQVNQHASGVLTFLKPKHIENNTITEYYLEALVNITYIIRQVVIVVDVSTMQLLHNAKFELERLFKLFEVSISIVPDHNSADTESYISFLREYALHYLEDCSVSPHTKLYPISMCIREMMLESLGDGDSQCHENILSQVYYPYCHFDKSVIDTLLKQLTIELLSSLNIDVNEYLKATHLALGEVFANEK